MEAWQITFKNFDGYDKHAVVFAATIRSAIRKFTKKSKHSELRISAIEKIPSTYLVS